MRPNHAWRAAVRAAEGLLLAGLLASPGIPGDTFAAEEAVDRGPDEPIRITDEEVHEAGGIPPGWKFRLPDGDPAAGRAVFIKMECFRCHTVKGEKFPAVDRGPKDVGPELTGIGSEHHPPEYLAESIVNPNRVILAGPGYSGADGSSLMPSYAHLMNVEELINLTAYLGSLKETADEPH